MDNTDNVDDKVCPLCDAAKWPDTVVYKCGTIAYTVYNDKDGKAIGGLHEGEDCRRRRSQQQEGPQVRSKSAAALLTQWQQFLDERNIQSPCPACSGLGVRVYGSTATWRGGIGGQTLTQDVCSYCWGSGDANRKWPSWRHYEALQRKVDKLREEE